MEWFNLDGIPKIIFGSGIFETELPNILATIETLFNAKKIMIVTGSHFTKKYGYLDSLCNLISKKNLSYEVFDKVSPNPKTYEVDELVDKLIKTNCNMIISFGGGSVIDIAKAANISFALKQNILTILNQPMFLEKCNHNELLPLIAIPTRYGSASEISVFSVITNKNTNEKLILTSPYIMPKLAIIDPTFCLNLSFNEFSYAVVDIFSHLIETFISAENNSDIADSLTITLIFELIKNTLNLLNDFKNISLHENIFYISTLALTGISQAGRLGNFPLHDLALPLSAYFDLSHGLSLGILFEPFIKLSYEYALEQYEKLYEVFEKLVILGFKFNKFQKLNDTYSKALNVTQCIIEFLSILKVNQKLSNMNINLNEQLLEKIASDVIRLYGNGKIYIENPKKLYFSDIIEIYKQIL